MVDFIGPNFIGCPLHVVEHFLVGHSAYYDSSPSLSSVVITRIPASLTLHLEINVSKNLHNSRMKMLHLLALITFEQEIASSKPYKKLFIAESGVIVRWIYKRSSPF